MNLPDKWKESPGEVIKFAFFLILILVGANTLLEKVLAFIRSTNIFP